VKASGCRFVAAGEFFDVFAALEANPRYFQSRTAAATIWKDLVVPSIREIYPVVLDTVRSTSVFDNDGSQALRGALLDFLRTGDPPVVAGFGSAASLHAVLRYRAVAEACRRLGKRCVLIGASAVHVPQCAEVIAVDAVPYSDVFPAASVVVHHGGFGTCAEALRAGKPSLVTPFAFDQFDTAVRLYDRRLGVWLRGDPTNTDAVTAALNATMNDSSLASAARQAASEIRTAVEGAERAAELIESSHVNSRSGTPANG